MGSPKNLVDNIIRIKNFEVMINDISKLSNKYRETKFIYLPYIHYRKVSEKMFNDFGFEVTYENKLFKSLRSY